MEKILSTISETVKTLSITFKSKYGAEHLKSSVCIINTSFIDYYVKQCIVGDRTKNRQALSLIGLPSLVETKRVASQYLYETCNALTRVK